MRVRVLVTGAGGMLGSEVVRQARARGHQVVALDRAELDVTDAAAVEREVAQARAGAVVNCAGFTDVDGAEGREAEATRVNGEGAGNLARAAAAAGARLAHVSTDYVFPGDEPWPRREEDPTGPRSAYGRSKLEGERQVLAAGGGPLVVRAAWLYGGGGRNFVDTIRARVQSEPGARLRVVDDQVGSPTWSASLARALLDLLALGATGVVHFANRGAVSWRRVAEAVVEETGAGAAVEPISSRELGRPAPRPAFSALDTARFEKLAGREPLDWRAALRLYLRGARDEGEGPPPAAARGPIHPAGEPPS